MELTQHRGADTGGNEWAPKVAGRSWAACPLSGPCAGYPAAVAEPLGPARHPTRTGAPLGASSASAVSWRGASYGLRGARPLVGAARAVTPRSGPVPEAARRIEGDWRGGVLHRRAGRALVVDPDGAVLLLQGLDPARPAAGTWWFTPGGGAHPRESLVSAMLRELAEETGIEVPTPGPAVWIRTTEFDYLGVRIRQEEEFFLVRVGERVEVDTSGFNELEQQAVLGSRWWLPAELGASDEIVYPSSLAVALLLLLDALEAGWRPTHGPLAIGP